MVLISINALWPTWSLLPHRAIFTITPTPVQDAYDVTIDEEEIRMTFRILNSVFLNWKNGA